MTWVQKEGYKTKELASGIFSITNEYEIGEVHFLKGKYSHYHKKKTEFFYILGGKGKIIIEGKERYIKKGDFIAVKPNKNHTWINNSKIFPLKAIMMKIDNDKKDTYQLTD